jgi:hypothetical protein
VTPRRNAFEAGSRWPVRIAAWIFASMSLAALVGHVVLHVPMNFTLQFFAVPTLLALVALAVLARRLSATWFTNALAVGCVAGLAATVVYDGVRLIIQSSHPFGYNGFVPILMFGSWITGLPIGTPLAVLAGWLYHYWNGLSFAIMYVLLFGNRSWWFGVGYGVFMELCMLGLFPLFIKINNPVGFVLISMIGHLFYGAVLGIICQRYARPL